MRAFRKKEHTGIEANLTSLIDVTFLLIVFFVLVSKLNEVEIAKMDLPSPADAATVQLEAEHQVVISVLPAPDGEAAAYRVGTTDFSPDPQGLQAMTARLADLYRTNPKLDVNVRADRATHYERVEPVMQALATAARGVAGATGMARVNLVVVREK